MMENLFALPMTPAQSWTLIGLVFVTVLLAVYMTAYVDQTIQLTSWNLSITGKFGRALFDALLGIEYVEILQEQSIEATKGQDGYILKTSDTETSREYLIVPLKEDPKDYWYNLAKWLAGDNEELFEALKPRGRVVQRIKLEDEDTGEERRVMFIYLKTVNSKEIEEVANEFFRDEFFEERKEARKEARESKKKIS